MNNIKAGKLRQGGGAGAKPLYLHEKDGLIFTAVKLGDVPGPLVEVILSFHLEDNDGPQWDPLREIRMFHNVTIKLVPENGIQPFKFRHGQSPRRNRRRYISQRSLMSLSANTSVSLNDIFNGSFRDSPFRR